MDTIADYNEWKRKRQEQAAGAAGIVLQAIDDKPDDVAADINLANEFGKVTGNPVPPSPMVREYRSLFQKKVEEARSRTILSDAPRLADWLRNPENAALSRDDIARLAWVERFGLHPQEASTSFAEGLVNTARRAGVGISLAANQIMLERTAGRAQDIKRSFGEILEDQRQSGLKDAQGNWVPTWDGEYLPAFARWLDSRWANMLGIDAEKDAAEFARRVNEAQDRFRAIPKSDAAKAFEDAAIKKASSFGEAVVNWTTAIVQDFNGFFAWAVETVGENFPQLVAGFAATAITRNPGAGMAVAGLGSYATERYRSPVEFFEENELDLRKPEDVQKLLSSPDLMKEAADRGVIRGLVVGAFDALGMGIAGMRLFGNPVVEGIAQLATQVVTGSVGEYSARVAAGQEVDWNDVLAEGFAEFVTTPVDMGIAGRSFIEARRKAQEADGRKAVFEALSGVAQESTLRSRLPDRFREFVERATANGPIENVYIPAEKFKEYFQGLGVDPWSLVDELDGITQDDLDIALATGGDLRIPTATYAAKIAGSEHDAFLIENMRFDPDHMTAAEAAEFNARVQEALQEAFDEAERLREMEEQFKPFEQLVYETVLSGLRAAGRSLDVARTEAALYTAYVRTAAADEGLTIEEYLDRYPLPDFRGAIPEGAQFKQVDELTRTLAEARARRAAGTDGKQKGPTLLEFIDQYGGIADRGGELRARDAAVIKRGRGKKTLRLARSEDASGDMLGGARDGKSYGPDDVARAAIEAGYMADHPIVQRYFAAIESGRPVPDVTAALWDAIDEELRGNPQYVAGAIDEDAQQRGAFLDQLEEYLAGLGVSINDPDDVIREAIRKDEEARRAGMEDARMYGQDEVLPTKVIEDVDLDRLVFREEDQNRTEQVRDLYPDDSDLPPIVVAETADGLLILDGHNRAVVAREDGRKLSAVAISNQAYKAALDAGFDEIEIAHTALEDAGEYDASSAVRQQFPGVDLFGKDDAIQEILEKYPVQSDARMYNQSGRITINRFEQQGKGRARGAITAMPDGRTVIDLFEGANLSTVLHETGHYWLLNLQARAANGSQVAAERMEVLKTWWRDNARAVARDAMRAAPGIEITPQDVISAIENGTTGDDAKDNAIDVGMQEQFARAAEAYFMEGKAPSVELRTIFDRFRAWLISVYRRIVNLDVNLNDDVRRVFDRILATEDEIAKAQEQIGGSSPVFTTAEAMGLTEEEYRAFLKVRERAEDDAKTQLLRQTMAPIKREQEKEYREERAKVREQVEREVNSWRVYRAIEWMGNRRWLGANQPEGIPDIRLSKDILIERYGAGVLQTLPRGMQTVYAVEGGMDPDDAAAWFGFASGDEMIKAMEQAPRRIDAIEAETDKAMRDRYGDPLNDGSIELQALDAVHSEKHSDWLAAELKAIAEVAEIDLPLTAKQARESARQVLARMKVRDATASNRYLAAERKAAEEAARLGAQLSRNKIWIDAAKRRIASKARAAIKGKASPDSVATAIDQYNAQFETTETTFEVKPQTRTSKTGREYTIPGGERTVTSPGYNEMVRRFVDAKRRQLINHALYMESRKVAEEVEKAERFVAKLNKASHREKIAGAGRRENVTIDYLAAIDDVLDRYDFRRMSGRAEQKRGALNAYVEAMRAAGRENELAIPEKVLQNANRVPYKTLSVEELRGVIDTLKNLEHAALRWNEFLVNKQKRELAEAVQIIVGSIDNNVRGKPKDWARTKRIPDIAGQTVAGYMASVKSATQILRMIDGRRDLGPVYELLKADFDAAGDREQEMSREAARKLQELFDLYTEDEQRQMAVDMVRLDLRGQSFSKWNLIAMALNMGNEGNLARLTNDAAKFHLTEAEVEIVKGMLDERDAKFIQGVWDLIDSYWPLIVERDKRVKGVAPEKVEATPVVIGGVQLRGGYYPIKYDQRHGGGRPTAADSDDDILQSIMGGGYSSAHTKDGHLKARGSHVRQSLLLDISVINQHLNEVIHDLTHSEPVVNTWRMLTHNEVEQAFLNAGLDEEYRQLKLWVQDAATGQVGSASTLARAITYLRGGFAYSKLAYSLRTMIMQPLGVMQSAVAVGKARIARHMLRMMRNPVEIARSVEAKSKMMQMRRDTFNKDLMDASRQSNIVSPAGSKAGAFMNEWVIPLGMAGMVYTQYYAVDVPTWMAAYEKGLDQFKGDDVKAVQYADMTVKRVQGSGLWSDRTGIERGTLSGSTRQNPFVTLLTTLGSYFFAKMNMAIERTQGLRAEPVTPQAAMSYGLDMALLFAGEAIIITLVSSLLSGGGDDDDETIAGTIFKESIKTVTAGLPIVRDAVGLASGFDAGTYAAILNTIVKPMVQASQGDFDKSLVKSTINLVGMLARLPSAQINRAVDATWRKAEGEDVSPLEFLMGRMGK